MDRRAALSLIASGPTGALLATAWPMAVASPGADMSRGRLPVQVWADTPGGDAVERCTVDGLFLADVIYADEVNGFVDHIQVHEDGLWISDGPGTTLRIVPVSSIPNTQRLCDGGSSPIVRATYRTFGYVLLTFSEPAARA